MRSWEVSWLIHIRLECVLNLGYLTRRRNDQESVVYMRLESNQQQWLLVPRVEVQSGV